jgi:hypothetical protein
MPHDYRNPASRHSLCFDDLERGRYVIVFDRATGQKTKLIILDKPRLTDSNVPVSSPAYMREENRIMVQVLDDKNTIQLRSIAFMGVIPHVYGDLTRWNRRFVTVEAGNESQLPQLDSKLSQIFNDGSVHFEDEFVDGRLQERM